MNLIDRAKNMIVSPATEWNEISSETPDTGKIITGFVLPLAGAAAVAAFIGYSFLWVGFFGSPTTWGLYFAITSLLQAIISVFVGAAVVDALAPSFDSQKNMGRSVQLIAYAYTPVWIGGLLAIYPPIAIIGMIFGLYMFYLLYLGIPKLKNTPVDKQIGYFVVSIVVMLVVYFIIGMILSKLLLPAMGLSYGIPGLNLGGY